jgi:hypothetical protein
MAEKAFMYKDALPIKTFNSSVWLVKFEQGQQLLQVWHKEAKIEDIVIAVKMEFATGPKFTVSAVDVGSFWLHSTKTSLTNGRMVNQDMEVVV